MTRIISIVGGMQPSAPTIGTATAGDTSASVAFTASSYIGKGTITYTATSSPGGFTATGASSPLTVTGLTNGTAYTFTVVGTTNYGVASATTAASNSVTPATASSYESIASTLVSSSSSLVEFTSIPQTFKHLQVRIVARCTANSDREPIHIMLNNLNTSIYTTNFFNVLGSGGSNTVSITGYDGTVNNMGGSSTVPGTAAASASLYGISIIDFLEYSNTGVTKTPRSFATQASGNFDRLTFIGGIVNTTAAISSIQLRTSTAWASGSRLSLYGIKG